MQCERENRIMGEKGDKDHEREEGGRGGDFLQRSTPNERKVPYVVKEDWLLIS